MSFTALLGDTAGLCTRRRGGIFSYPRPAMKFRLPALAPVLSLSNGLLATVLLGLTACTYDFPLTEQPTQNLDPRLLGDWVSYDSDDQQVRPLHVRRLDATAYVVAFDGDLYRVNHSDLAGTAFVSVQNLQAGDDYGKFTYCLWTLSPDGRQLTLRTVQSRVVSGDLQDAAAVRKLITANLANPDLLGDPIVFTPKKR
jgi:hypothetical protein